MAEYLLQDKDKAAFINRMNKILTQIGPGLGLDQNSFVDVPENEDEDKCIYVAGSDVEERIVDSLIDKNAFSYKVKKIDVNEMLKEIKKEYIDEASRLQKLAGILKEEVKVLTLGDLEVGNNVEIGDILPEPDSDMGAVIYAPVALDKYLQDKDLSLEVIIDRSQRGSDVFRIPAFEEGREQARSRKERYLSGERSQGRFTGMD